jgi:hypothetical protein
MHKLVAVKPKEADGKKEDREESLREARSAASEDDRSLFEVWPNEGRGTDSGVSYSP